MCATVKNTSSQDPRNYWKVLKHRLQEEGSQVVTKCNQLKLEASDGKRYLTDCANTEGMFRLIQSIPSPKAEPFKLWLAKAGYERVRGIAVRQELVDEWKDRGVQQDKDFAVLTLEISKATFGLTPSEYKDHKGLSNQNLRDHMDDIELILTMLGEATWLASPARILLSNNRTPQSI